MPGADVTLYADGRAIGRATASDSTMDIHTDGNVKLADGLRAITAVQTLRNQAVNVGNLRTQTDLASPASTPLAVRIDTTAPQFTSTPVTRAGLGIPYVYDAQTDDETGTGAIYRLLQGPDGLTIDPIAGQLSWTPGPGQSGLHDVTIEAADQWGRTSRQSFKVNVAEPPSLVPLGDLFVDPGELVQFTITAAGENTPLRYMLVSGPNGVSFDPASGLFRWRPSEADAGTRQSVVVRVTDSVGASDQEAVATISVRSVTSIVAFAGTKLDVSVPIADPALAGKPLRYGFVQTPPAGITLSLIHI
mgnify:CR=1 FL=1